MKSPLNKIAFTLYLSEREKSLGIGPVIIIKGKSKG
jgi:hypothetical protein